MLQWIVELAEKSNFGIYFGNTCVLTLCLSMWIFRRFGSKSSLCGSKLTGDCLFPLLHRDHSGLISPQNAGPEKKTYFVNLKSDKYPIGTFKNDSCSWSNTNSYII